MKRAVRIFFEEMADLGLEINVSPDEILMQNIVAKGDMELEFDLSVLSVGLGLERCEYEPEQFPGIVFRSQRSATVLIFGTGKFLITGSKSYADVFQVASDLYEELQSLGIDVSQVE